MKDKGSRDNILRTSHGIIGNEYERETLVSESQMRVKYGKDTAYVLEYKIS